MQLEKCPITLARCLFRRFEIQCNASILVASHSLDNCLIRKNFPNHHKSSSITTEHKDKKRNLRMDISNSSTTCRRTIYTHEIKGHILITYHPRLFWLEKLHLLAIERIAPTSNPSAGSALMARSSSLVSRATFRWRERKIKEFSESNSQKQWNQTNTTTPPLPKPPNQK